MGTPPGDPKMTLFGTLSGTPILGWQGFQRVKSPRGTQKGVDFGPQKRSFWTPQGLKKQWAEVGKWPKGSILGSRGYGQGVPKGSFYLKTSGNDPKTGPWDPQNCHF